MTRLPHLALVPASGRAVDIIPVHWVHEAPSVRMKSPGQSMSPTVRRTDGPTMVQKSHWNPIQNGGCNEGNNCGENS